MSHHRWELSPLGCIPHEVLSILLGSLPKVPDPRLEEKALERQSEGHDDRLSDDDDEEDGEVEAGRTSLLVQESKSRQREAAAQCNVIINHDSEKTKRHLETEDYQKPWNVPDDEWAWSDEEPSASSFITPKSMQSTIVSRQNPSAKSPKKMSAGFALSSNISKGQRAHNDVSESASSTTSTSASAVSSPSLQSGLKTLPLNNNTTAVKSHPLTVAQDLSISVCDSGRYIACASTRMFAILTRMTHPSNSRPPSFDSDQGQKSLRPVHEWVLIGQGSGVDSELDAITTILCLPLFVPRSHQSQVYVVLGYKSGMIRIFNESGQLVVVQQLHHTPVISIKARIGIGKTPGQDEDEMTILHEEGKIVCIEGESLWVVLRLSNGSGRSSDNKSIQVSQAPTFAYKKWSLQNQGLMVDVVSCGPARHKPTLSNGFSSSSSSSMFTSDATERFVSVGSKPMMAFYASSSSSRPLFSATSLATQMAARVTNAVFGFAKSIWGSSSSPRSGSPAIGNTSGRSTPDQKRLSGSNSQDGAAGPYGTIYPSAMAPATEVPAVLWLSDPQRCIRHLSLAPFPPRGSCYHYPSKLAAMTDSLGRVLLVDLEECEIIRMWKGLRGARCGWVQEERIVRSGEASNGSSTFKKHLVLYLVIYAPKRGTVEIYPARQGKRVGVMQVGLGWKVCTTFSSPIGKPVLLDRISGASKLDAIHPSSREAAHSSYQTQVIDPNQLSLSQCLLIGPTGEILRVRSTAVDPSNISSPALFGSEAIPQTVASKSPEAETIETRFQSMKT
ncbi:Rab3 GTPase-activating protein regulatory subunit N-terminus-domain-containing protein [Lobosporangium transversale]|uniref:Rab3 GTPase-activating protein regulatory subunit N-terminus-domain-containing protein n=1 Tax=Lobosporangium transversale TaxID=64571 RepID=A0A1Y2GXP5_9FUNG|nr:Rab3 GTPase-activating protein regulatory subunit N-terminus-domain-containing protein [Lobosporangium transversale]ORZ27078.1 Rab3 GTPase-activating protein regulatory subunit N-terminus-domain-containing protein [Lobosporangium transversale]|eukprot:XP_021884825.1 Rab3 GTPase-activating protein regulatory subunit N-terminus-domain-containing protein [Lobosporangium transversale]